MVFSPRSNAAAIDAVVVDFLRLILGEHSDLTQPSVLQSIHVKPIALNDIGYFTTAEQ